MSIKPTALAVQLHTIPTELQTDPRWLLWRYVERSKPNGDKVWAKMPVQTSGRPASTTNPATWTTFEDAVDALISGGFEGIGYVLGANVQGIDLDDCRDPDTGALSELAQEFLDRVDGYAEVSPSATGIKVFSRTNLDTSRSKKGVEVYGSGRYFTVTGHTINGHSGLPADVQDVGWFVLKEFGENLSPESLTGDLADLALANYKPPLEDWDLERVEQEVLPHLDADCSYEAWLKVGAAMHHQSQGDHDWLLAWDMWSQGSGKYAEGYCEQKWRSFSEQRVGGHGAVTLASLLKQTKDQRYEVNAEERRELLDELLDSVETCSVATLLQDRIAARAANSPDLSDIERATLAKAIVVKAKGLGSPVSLTTVRGWLRCRVRAATVPSAPDWANEWVYVTEGDKFLNLSTKQEVTPQGFRAQFNRLMPMDQQGNRERADQAALELWDVPVVTHKSYMPSAGPVFELFGLQWANLYRPESVPEVPGVMSAEALEAIELIKQHVAMYLGDEREQHLLLSWLAHNVQHPGAKIRWAPYVCGVPGDGKSFFGELIGLAMGGQNVRILNGSTLESNFTDWAVGYAVVIIEEMKQHGHNRFDIMNRVKPVITNTVIEVHPKGRASYTAPNVSNYLIFSNYLDGAPVDESDRRYMFLVSDITTERAKELTNDGHFSRLFGAVQAHAGAVRQWLLEMPLHDEFDANGRAPHTTVKDTVVEMSKTDLQVTTEDVIEQGGPGITRDVISSSHLTRALAAVNDGERPATARVNNLLSTLGFRFQVRKKWQHEACRIWVRNGSGLSDDAAVVQLNGSADASMDFLR